MRALYNILSYFLAPFAVLRLYLRARRAPNYKKRIAERFGRVDIPKDKTQGLWVHAVSVGEVLASQPLIKALMKHYPDLPMTVTCTTPTGSERIQLNLPPDVFHVYLPYDLPCVMQRFLKRLKPRIAILMETELWPNLLYYTHKLGIPSVLANGRLSEKSAKGYSAPIVRSLSRQMMQDITLICAQAQHDAKHFEMIGAPKDKIHIVGNIKFDMELSPSQRETASLLRSQLGNSRPVWIAASTHEGEEEKILTAHKAILKKMPDALLILVPRHPERFDKVASLCEKQALATIRRSEQTSCDANIQVYLGDTMGELRILLGAADIAFIGGSLVDVGGHNMLEAALYAMPILSGNITYNFVEITKMLCNAGAMTLVKNEHELASQLLTLLQDANLRETVGQAAEKVVRENRGALDKHLQLIETLIKK